MYAILSLVTACIALEVWVPLIVAGKTKAVAQIEGLTVEQAQELLDYHNKKRVEAGGSDMIRLEWDPLLGWSAQTYAEECNQGTHSSNYNRRGLKGYGVVGENIYWTTGDMHPLDGAKGWYNEEKDFDSSKINDGWRKSRNSGGVLHYTQMIWAKTRTVGCGAYYCSPWFWGSPYNLLVCQYGEMGNMYGEYVYNRHGSYCSKCPAGHKNCVKKLCSRYTTDNTKVTTVATDDGSLLTGSCLTFLLLSCATLAQIML